ncbi:cation channel family protein (macronuclear) [Tetrahymena thermophila SB210]|uniref:Cation channel family protein n=1 Tax=Tetrahymena thermophila (strain SB210) TaxID=312017 RepID=Q24GG7_TETTS|nr:cation channel family protein [Tetrahymena thermophila SB210]EAS06904.2 cation channel family protein [Tetrahymena thermophila SB210]|eukprot:XP_001027146.2 cation channel family protein [Tetrahymena thermophila SB210]
MAYVKPFFKSYQDLNSDCYLGQLDNKVQLSRQASIESDLSINEKKKLRKEFAVKNFQKPIKRLSLETQLLLKNPLSLIQSHSQNQNTSNRIDNNSQNICPSQQLYHPQTDQQFNTNFKVQIHRKNDNNLEKQDKAKKGILLKRAQIVVNEIKKNIQIHENQISLDQNCQILNYFYEQGQIFDKFNHQFVQIIEQGKLITDEINYENKYDPAAVRTMSALKAKSIFLVNGFQEKQTSKFLKAAVNNSKILRFQKNDYIYHQNEEPLYFYYLLKGELQAYSDSKRDLSFKGDIIYQRPLMEKKKGQISFNDFNDILNQFGGENIAQSQRLEKKSKQNKNQLNNLNQYLVKLNKLQKSQSEHSSIRQDQQQNQQLDKKINKQNQCTVELQDKTVRSLYYDQFDEKQKGQSKLDQLIQMSFHLGYKNTHQINKLNERALKNKYDIKPSNSLLQNPFYQKNPQNSRHRIQQFDLRRRFDNYTFRLDKSERSSQSKKQPNRKKVLQFLEGYSQRSDETSSSCDQIQYEINKSLKKSQSNKTINIHTQIKKQINNLVTPREQKQFKTTLQFYSNQQRIQNENLMQENTNQYFLNPNSQIIQNSQENLLQILEKPHQTELRNRISSFIKQKSQIKISQKQSDPQLRIIQSSLSQRQNKLKVDHLQQSPVFNASQSQIYQIQNNTSRQIYLDNSNKFQYFQSGQYVDGGDSQDYSQILQLDKTNQNQTQSNKTQNSYFLRKSYSEKSNQFLKSILNNEQKKQEKSASKNFKDSLKKTEQINEILNITNISRINQSNNLKTQDSLQDYLKISQAFDSPKQSKVNQINNIK